MPERKRFGGKRKGTNAAALPDVLSSLPSQNEDFIGTVLSKNDNIFSDLAYVENDYWWGWAFAPGGFALGVLAQSSSVGQPAAAASRASTCRARSM